MAAICDEMSLLDLDNVVKSGLDDLDQVVKSEIKAKQLFVEERMPANFDFEIGDEVFTRKVNGESISVEVDIPNPMRYSGGVIPSLNLVVKITKENGKTVTFNASVWDDEITVESMSIRLPTDSRWIYSSNKEEYFVEKGGNMQSAMREYLKSRGIKKSNTDFMREYSDRISKRTLASADVLKNLQNFLKD